MPELPDLQVFSMNLEKQLAGKVLKKIKIFPRANVNVSKQKLSKALEGQKVSRIYRDGKQLHIAFQNKNILALHMMLHGELHWIDEKNPQRFALLELHFPGKGIVLTDFQRKATITLNPETTEAPDALSKEVTINFWKQALQSRSKLKNLLLDQHVIRGIGNAYADEILWSARISPFSVANKLPLAKIRSLATSVKKILTKAIKQIRKSDPKIIGGEIRDFLLIHNPKAKKSPTGKPIKVKASGARKTYYTNEQKLFA